MLSFTKTDGNSFHIVLLLWWFCPDYSFSNSENKSKLSAQKLPGKGYFPNPMDKPSYTFMHKWPRREMVKVFLSEYADMCYAHLSRIFRKLNILPVSRFQNVSCPESYSATSIK